MGFFDDAIGSIGKSLATAATSYITETTGYDVGGTLAYLFGGDQASKGETLASLTENLQKQFSGTQEALTLLRNDLNNQAAQLDRIGDQLTAMAGAIQDIDGEIRGIEALLKQIGQEQRYLSWQQQDNQIKVFVAKIDSSFQQYAEYVKLSTTVASVKDLVRSVLDPNGGELNACREINSFMLTDQQNKGALQLWAEMTCPLIEDGLLDYRQAVDQYFAYYTKLAWAQLRATNLVMEAYHFNGEVQLAAQAWQDYKKLLLGQESEFIGNLVSLVRSGLIGSLDNHYGLTLWHAIAQFHPDRAELVKNGDYIGTYYEPSSVLMAGEALLARLALTDATDRRMVVHVTFFGDAFKTAIDAANITLDMVDTSEGGTISPATAPSVYGPMATVPFPQGPGFPDEVWFNDSRFYVKRLVYASTPEKLLYDGLYRLSNLNGEGSLQPMETYLGKVPFVSDAVLGYTMEVNAAQQFDYMNFGAYFSNRRLPT